VWEISQRRMTIGQLLSFAGFLGYLYPPLRNLGQLGLTFTAATAGAERLLEVLDTEPAVTDPDPDRDARPWDVAGIVEFDRVAVRDRGGDRARRAERGRPRLHRRSAGGVRHPRRPAHRAALRWPAAAHRRRPRDAPRHPRARPRRTDHRARSAGRAGAGRPAP